MKKKPARKTQTREGTLVRRLKREVALLTYQVDALTNVVYGHGNRLKALENTVAFEPTEAP